MLGGDGEHGKAERMEFGHAFVLALRAVHLVHDQQHRLAAPTGKGGQVLVEREQPFPAVRHQADHGGFPYGGLGLTQDLGLETAESGRPFHHGAVLIQRHPAGIDHHKASAPARSDHAFHTIPGDAGAIVGDGPIAPDQPVEQGRLAHVGPADQGDFGKHLAVLAEAVFQMGVRRAAR